MECSSTTEPDLLLQKTQTYQFHEQVKDDHNFKELITNYHLMKKLAEHELPQNQKPESDNIGKTEYKRWMILSNEDYLTRRTTQMVLRLGEGNGLAYYKVGVEDDGVVVGLDDVKMEWSLATLFLMSQSQNVHMSLKYVKRGYEGYWAKISLWKDYEVNEKINVKVIMLGSQAAGKSTLVGVLISGKEDNGKGFSRVKVLRHQSEYEDGFTKKISLQLLGFNQESKITNYDCFSMHPWEKIVHNSSKLLTFIDVSGSQKYKRTLLQGLIGYQPDYAILVLDVVKGEKAFPQEQIQLAKVQMIPMMVVITMIDRVSMEQLKSFQSFISQKLMDELNLQSLVIQYELSIQKLLLSNDTVVPIFSISNIKSRSLELLRNFLSTLQPSKQLQNLNQERLESNKAEFYISELVSSDNDSQIIVNGFLFKGILSQDSNVVIGPFGFKAEFIEAAIVDIHLNRVSVKSVKSGALCSLALKFKDYNDSINQSIFQNYVAKVRCGMVIKKNSNKEQMKASWTFEAQISTYDNSTKFIKYNRSFILQTSTLIRQEVKAIKIENDAQNLEEFLDTIDITQNNDGVMIKSLGQQTKVTLQFVNQPEYVKIGSQIIISQGDFKIIGEVTKACEDYSDKTKGIDLKRQKRKKSLTIMDLMHQNSESK